MDATITQLTPTGPEQSQRRGIGKLILPIVIIVILLAIIGGGAYYLRSKEETIPAPTPAPTIAEPTPTEQLTPIAAQTLTPTGKGAKPTPTKTVLQTSASSSAQTPSTKGLTLKVLNGSGVAGKAGTAADYLKGLGYAVSSTGNADNFNYDQSTITIKAAKQSSLASLKTDLAAKYAVGTTSATLASIEDVDAVVIIGKQ